MLKVLKGIYLLTVREDAGMQEASLEMQLQSMCDGGLLIRCMSCFHIRKKIILGVEIFARILIFFLSRIIWLIFWDCDDAETLRPPIAASMLPPPGLSQPDRQEMKRSGLLKPLELMLGWGGSGGAPICLQPEVPRWGDIVLEPLRRPHLRPLRGGKSWLVLLAPVAKEFVLRLSGFSLIKDGQSSGAPLPLRFFGAPGGGKVQGGQGGVPKRWLMHQDLNYIYKTLQGKNLTGCFSFTTDNCTINNARLHKSYCVMALGSIKITLAKVPLLSAEHLKTHLPMFWCHQLTFNYLSMQRFNIGEYASNSSFNMWMLLKMLSSSCLPNAILRL